VSVLLLLQVTQILNNINYENPLSCLCKYAVGSEVESKRVGKSESEEREKGVGFLCKLRYTIQTLCKQARPISYVHCSQQSAAHSGATQYSDTNAQQLPEITAQEYSYASHLTPLPKVAGQNRVDPLPSTCYNIN
jgi:hypothetical protein